MTPWLVSCEEITYKMTIIIKLLLITRHDDRKNVSKLSTILPRVSLFRIGSWLGCYNYLYNHEYKNIGWYNLLIHSHLEYFNNTLIDWNNRKGLLSSGKENLKIMKKWSYCVKYSICFTRANALFCTIASTSYFNIL